MRGNMGRLALPASILPEKSGHPSTVVELPSVAYSCLGQIQKTDSINPVSGEFTSRDSSMQNQKPERKP